MSEWGVKVCLDEVAKGFNPLLSAGAWDVKLCGYVCGKDCVEGW